MIRPVQSPDTVKKVYSLLKHFQGYLGIFKDTDACSATLRRATRERGEASLPFLKTEKNALIFGKKRP